MRYFHKELISNLAYDTNGAKIIFEPVQDHNGILAVDETDDKGKVLAESLDLLISKRRGGVTEITQARYEDLKKNPTLKAFVPLSAPPSGPRLIAKDLQVPLPVTAPSAPSATAPVAATPVAEASPAPVAVDASASPVEAAPAPAPVERPQLASKKSSKAPKAPKAAPAAAAKPAAQAA